jgi:hypothetical protein
MREFREAFCTKQETAYFQQVDDPEPHSLEFRAALLRAQKNAWAVLKTECALIPLRASQRTAPVRGWLAPGTGPPLSLRAHPGASLDIGKNWQ